MSKRRTVITHVLILISQVNRFAHDNHIRAAAPSLANARIKNGAFKFWVNANKQDLACMIDVFNSRRTYVSTAVARRKLGIISPALNVAALSFDQSLQCKRGLSRRKIPDETRNLFTLHCCCSSRKRFGPRCWSQLPVLTQIRCIQTLAAQTIPYEAGFVRNPLFVHAIVVARQKAHYFTAFGINANVGAKRVHHVDRLCFGQFPRARSESIGL